MESVLNWSVIISIIGVLVVLTNIVVQVLKKVTWDKLPTNALAMIVSLVLTLGAFFAYCSKKTILAEKSFWSVHGHGKINSADELYRSLRKWALPVIGTESVLRWMRAAIKQLRKFL